MKKGILVVVISLLGLCSCKNTSESQPEVSKEVVDKAPDLLEKKKAKGDTLVLATDSLSVIIPDKVEGFELTDKPVLESQSFPGSSWSKVKKVYKQDQNRLKISLVDYNGAYGIYAGAVSVFSNMENDEEKSQTLTLDNGKMKAWESYNKLNGDAALLIGIADRYLVTIELDNQEGTEGVKSIVDKIKLRELPGY